MSDEIDPEHPFVPFNIFLFDDENVEQCRAGIAALIEKLSATRSWSIAPPLLIDQIADRGDEPFHYLGAHLSVYAHDAAHDVPADLSKQQYDETRALIIAFQEFSKATKLAFEVQYDNGYVGFVAEGMLNPELIHGFSRDWLLRIERTRWRATPEAKQLPTADDSGWDSARHTESIFAIFLRSADEVERSRQFIARIAERLGKTRSWSIRPPTLVDELAAEDENSELRPIFGVCLPVYSHAREALPPLEISERQLQEVDDLRWEFQGVTKIAPIELEVHFNSRPIGSMKNGESTELVHVFLGNWRDEIERRKITRPPPPRSGFRRFFNFARKR